MNIRRLKAIANLILQTPKHYNQEFAGNGSCVQSAMETAIKTRHNVAGNNCGTGACIAGYAAARFNPVKYRNRNLGNEAIFSIAQKELGLTRVEADTLFAPTDELGWMRQDEDGLYSEFTWPEKFRTQYNKAKTGKGRARAAYNRIMHFIATKGKE